ncbi:MAG: CHASE2 domain-containing protein [Candidatus Melainabacteria bacterium]
MASRQAQPKPTPTSATDHAVSVPPLVICLWGVVLVLVMACFYALNAPGILHRLELSMLDVRLLLRSERFIPSDDIVIVGIDRKSFDYGVNHPEYQLPRRMMPRGRVAQILNHISAQHPRAVILDISFNGESTPEEDAVLEDAIRRAGNVYIAESAELNLAEYKARQNPTPQAYQAALNRALFMTRLLPYVRAQATLSARWGLPAYYPALGLQGVSDIPAMLGLPTAVFRGPWDYELLNPSKPSPRRRGWLRRQPKPGEVFASRPAIGNPMDALYAEDCLTHIYRQTFAAQPEFLDWLATHGTPLTWDQERLSASPLLDPITYCSTLAVHMPFFQAARGVGMTSVKYEGDSQLRTVTPFYRTYGDVFYPYLGIRPLVNERSQATLRLNDAGDALKVSLNGKTLPLDAHGEVMINWRHPRALVASILKKAGLPATETELRRVDLEAGTDWLGYGHLYRIVSAVDVLLADEGLNPDPVNSSLNRVYRRPDKGTIDFRDKIVIYGDTMTDMHRTPMGGNVYGPEILATVLDMTLNDHNFVRPAATWIVYGVVALLMGFVMLGVLRIRRFYLGIALAGLLLAGFWFYNVWMFTAQGWWIPIVTPSVLLLAATAGGGVYRYYVHDREKHQLTRVFSKYVSPQVMDQILASPANSMQNLAGAKKNLTVLFADLQGFTAQFETVDPELMVVQLNEFFTAMTRVILKHQGTYDKYMGDAIMAFFGAPVGFPDHARRACQAAMEMHAHLAELNESWAARGLSPLKIGVGLSSGDMVVGNFGSEDIKSFTVMGAAVNLGSRLEGLTRKVGSRIVVSDETRRQVLDDTLTRPQDRENVHFRDLGQVPVKGIREPVQIYGVELPVLLPQQQEAVSTAPEDDYSH